MANEFSEDTRSWWVRLLMSGFGILAVWVAALWAIEIVDTFVLDDQLQRNGIRPRATEGLDGATERELVRRLGDWLQSTGTGLVLVSHRPHPLSLAQHSLPIDALTHA